MSVVKPTGIDITTSEVREVRKGHVSLAVQTGSNDNAAMIDAFAANSRGGVVEMGEGVHFLNSSIMGAIPDGVTLAGVGNEPTGAKATVIKDSHPTSGSPIVSAVGNFRTPTLRNLAIDNSSSSIDPCFSLIGSSGTSGFGAVIRETSFYGNAMKTVYTFVISSGSATVGATYTNSGQTFTVRSTIASGTVLVAAGTGAPASSGTLTKASGTGDSSLSFSSVTSRYGALTEFDGGAGWGELIIDTYSSSWDHGGINTSNLYVRTPNLQLNMIGHKMLMGYGGKNIDCEASGFIELIGGYRACNNPIFTQATAGSAYKTLTVSFVSGSRNFTVTGVTTLAQEDTRHNAQASAISGTGVWIKEVTDSTHGKLSTPATATTSATMTLRRNTFNPATLGLCDIHLRGTHTTLTMSGGSDEGILELVRQESGQYGGIINLCGVYAASEFHMVSGLCFLNLSGSDVFSGFINSEAGTLVVNGIADAIGGYQGGTPPQSYGLVGTVEKPVMASRRDGAVICSDIHAFVQDYNADTTVSSLRIVRSFGMPTTQTLDISQTPPTNPNTGALHSDVHPLNGTIVRRGGLCDSADETKVFNGWCEWRETDGFRGHGFSHDAKFGGSNAIGDRLYSPLEVRDWINVGLSGAYATFTSSGATFTILTSKTTPINADSFLLSDSVASGLTKGVSGTNLKAYLKTYFDTLYGAGYSDEQAMDAIAAMIQSGTGISWSYNDGANTLTPTVSLAAFSTSNLAEGSNLYFTDERAQDAVGNSLVDSTTVDFTYNDGANTITAVTKRLGYTAESNDSVVQATDRNTTVTFNSTLSRDEGFILTTNDSLPNNSSALFEVDDDHFTGNDDFIFSWIHATSDGITYTPVTADLPYVAYQEANKIKVRYWNRSNSAIGDYLSMHWIRINRG